MVTNIQLAGAGGLTLNLVDFGGDGVPVLFIHGSFAHARAWDPVVAALPAGLHAFALDLPGHGDSAHAGDEARYAFDALVGDVGVAVQAMPASPVLVGHSIGAAIAMCYATSHPGTLAGAVLIDIDPCPPEYQVQHLNETGARPAKRYATFAEAIGRESRVAPAAPSAVHRHLALHGYRETGGAWEQKYDQAFLRAVRRWDLTEALGGISVPVLVIRGGASTVMSETSPGAMLARLPCGSAVTIPGAGHQVHLEQPAAVAAAIASFMESLAASAR